MFWKMFSWFFDKKKLFGTFSDFPWKLKICAFFLVVAELVEKGLVISTKHRHPRAARHSWAGRVAPKHSWPRPLFGKLVSSEQHERAEMFFVALMWVVSVQNFFEVILIMLKLIEITWRRRGIRCTGWRSPRDIKRPSKYTNFLKEFNWHELEHVSLNGWVQNGRC